ncbi:MAG: Mpo1-like protein [Pseudomonadota bacterium]
MRSSHQVNAIAESIIVTSKVERWLNAYGVSHQNPANKRIHWVCVPAIVVSLIGILWALPVPAAMREVSGLLNWGSIFLIAAMIYYVTLSPRLALGMVPVTLAIIAVVTWMASLPVSLVALSVGIFVVAWIGQFIGHKIEGQKPSFFEDVQFLMIGPLWILAAAYRQLGVRY